MYLDALKYFELFSKVSPMNQSDLGTSCYAISTVKGILATDANEIYGEMCLRLIIGNSRDCYRSRSWSKFYSGLTGVYHVLDACIYVIFIVPAVRM